MFSNSAHGIHEFCVRSFENATARDFPFVIVDGDGAARLIARCYHDRYWTPAKESAVVRQATKRVKDSVELIYIKQELLENGKKRKREVDDGRSCCFNLPSVLR